MAKGKKKGKKESEGEGASVSASIQDTPSTSQVPQEEEEEEGGLGLAPSSRKNKRKQKQAEVKAGKEKKESEGDVPSVAGLSISDNTQKESDKAEAPKPELKPEVKKEESKAEVKKEESKQEVKKDEEEKGGLGLEGPSKRRPRKKKSLAAAEAENKGQGDTSALQPVPEAAPQPQTTAVPAQTVSTQAIPAQAVPAQAGLPGVWQPQGMAVPPRTAGRGAALPTPGAGRGMPVGAGRASQAQPRPGPIIPPAQPFPTQAPSSRESTPMSSQSMEVVRASSSRSTICRYKIPAKIIGQTVNHVKTKVITNYLPMIFKPIKVFRYDVIIKPDRPKKMLPAAFKEALKKNYPKNPYIAFDQVKNCYTFEALNDVPSDGSSRNSILVDLPDPNGRMMRFDISFKATGVVDLAKLKKHMDSGGSSLETPCEEIQCIDVILRQGALESYVKCGRQFFKRPSRPIDLSGGLEMWTGLFQSAIFTTHAFINIDVAHKGFPVQQSMIDALTKSFKLSTDRKIEDQRSREIENFTSFLKGLRVVARLVGPPNNGQTREFIVNGLVDSPARLSFSCEKDGKKVIMTVAEYFSKEKGYKIKYPNLNCLWVGPRDKNIYYPMELVEVAYGQARNRQLNEFQLSNMVREAAAPPVERKRKIEEVAACMNYSNNQFFEKFGLKISNKFLEVEAKILAPPILDCGERNTIQPRRGVWQANRLVKPEALVSWGFIAIECDPNASNFQNIKDFLMNSGRQMGMEVSEPRMTCFNVRMTELRNILFSAVEKEVRFLFVIVGGRAKDTYHKVKQLAERDVGILTQCIKEYTASRRMNAQTIKNILLKVNSKLMGVNQVLDARAMPNCLKGGDVMIVGADVTHPSPDQTSIPSIAAVTASMDARAFWYSIELSIQTPKKEMIVEFAEMMYEHLCRWRERHRTLPRKVYVFRDGVSEGQFAEVMNSELAAVHKAYERFGPNRPQVLFLLVQKRHHTRFFTSPKCENVEPGTVVDTHIVHPKELDFYLVSHQAIKGTARPTRYHAVCNDSNIPHDEVEQLTYYLCHLYSRCMRAVSYPTPTYYAHLACFRARSLTYGQTFDNEALETKPQRLRVLDKMLKFSRMFFV